MILFNATSRRACALSDDKLTTGSVGIQVEFTFSDDWAAAPSRIAVFRGSGQTVDVALLEDSCTVPPEVLTQPGSTLTIGVYGTDGANTVVIPTVYAEAGRIARGAEPSGIEPTPQTQPLIDQLLAAADEAERLAQSVKDAADAGEFDGEDGEDGNGIWFIDAQYTRTTGAGVQAQLDHLVGRPSATPAVKDLCVVSDGRFGSIASLTVRVAVVPVLCDLSGKSAYELAVEHGYTGTEAEWLETLKGADAVVDPTLTNAGEAADAKATGDELHRHYLELTALSPEIRADTYAWNLRKNYNGSGSYVTADGFGITSNYIPVQPGARVQNTAPERDGNGKYTAMHINEFAGTTWLRRTILASGKYLTIGADATSIRIAYGYASNQGVTITQELIDATFSVRIIQQPASGSGGGGITVDDALSGSSTNPVQNKVVKAALDGKYTKPAGGIPASDLASAVQTSLGKADTALQSFTETDPTVPSWAKASSKPSYTASEVGAVAVAQGVSHAGEFLVVGSDGNVTPETVDASDIGAYAFPSGGIPKTDLAAAVQTSLGKADDALPASGNAYRTASIPMGQLDSTSTETVMTAQVDGITELRDGVCVWLENGVIASASGVTLNINSLGAKPIYNSLSGAVVTTTFVAASTYLFVYNSTRVTGGCWDMVYGYDTNTTYTPVKLGFGYATCSTAEATTAKTASLSSYTLTTGGIVAVKFTNSVPAGSTLNINSKGAKAIYYKGAAIKTGVIHAGDTVTMIYSTYYHVISIDSDIPAPFDGTPADVESSGTPGISTDYARADHVHGFDTVAFESMLEDLDAVNIPVILTDATTGAVSIMSSPNNLAGLFVSQRKFNFALVIPPDTTNYPVLFTASKFSTTTGELHLTGIVDGVLYEAVLTPSSNGQNMVGSMTTTNLILPSAQGVSF